MKKKEYNKEYLDTKLEYFLKRACEERILPHFKDNKNLEKEFYINNFEMTKLDKKEILKQDPDYLQLKFKEKVNDFINGKKPLDYFNPVSVIKNGLIEIEMQPSFVLKTEPSQTTKAKYKNDNLLRTYNLKKKHKELDIIDSSLLFSVPSQLKAFSKHKKINQEHNFDIDEFLKTQQITEDEINNPKLYKYNLKQKNSSHHQSSFILEQQQQLSNNSPFQKQQHPRHQKHYSTHLQHDQHHHRRNDFMSTASQQHFPQSSTNYENNNHLKKSNIYNSPSSFMTTQQNNIPQLNQQHSFHNQSYTTENKSKTQQNINLQFDDQYITKHEQALDFIRSKSSSPQQQIVKINKRQQYFINNQKKQNKNNFFKIEENVQQKQNEQTKASKDTAIQENASYLFKKPKIQQKKFAQRLIQNIKQEQRQLELKQKLERRKVPHIKIDQRNKALISHYLNMAQNHGTTVYYFLVKIARADIKEYLQQKFPEQIVQKFLSFTECPAEMDFRGFRLYIEKFNSYQYEDILFLCFYMMDFSSDGLICQRDCLQLIEMGLLNKLVEFDAHKIIKSVNEYQEIHRKYLIQTPLYIELYNLDFFLNYSFFQRHSRGTRVGGHLNDIKVKKNTVYQFTYFSQNHFNQEREIDSNLDEIKEKNNQSVSEQSQQQKNIKQNQEIKYWKEGKAIEFSINIEYFVQIFFEKPPLLFNDIIDTLALVKLDEIQYKINEDTSDLKTNNVNKELGEIIGDNKNSNTYIQEQNNARIQKFKQQQEKIKQQQFRLQYSTLSQLYIQKGKRAIKDFTLQKLKKFKNTYMIDELDTIKI